MAGKEGRPVIVEAKLQDFPTKAVAEYFQSINHGIYKNSGEICKWDQVPASASQELVHTLLQEDQVKKECGQAEKDCQEREKNLSQQWREIEELEEQLRSAFIETEDKIRALSSTESSGDSKGEKSIDERIAILETASRIYDGKNEWFTEHIQKATEATETINNEIQKLSPYMDFAGLVAKSQPALYPEGAISVLRHFERLQGAEEEITLSQESALVEMEQLRKEAQIFTSQALTKLDFLQAQIQQTRNQLGREKTEKEEASALIREKREALKISSGEVEKMEESVKCLYEQLWKRYHGHSSAPPQVAILPQTKYVQLVLTALENLVTDLQKAEPNVDESIQPEPNN